MHMAIKMARPYLEPVPEPYDLGFGVSDDLAEDNDCVPFYRFSGSRLDYEQWYFRVSEIWMETFILNMVLAN